MNWEFLLGLLLPAYGVGYVWLIKTAREDPPLYAVVETQLKTLLVVFQLAMAVTAVFAIKFSNVSPVLKMDLGSLAVLSIILASVVQQSFPFFRRIAALPEKETPKAGKEERHTEPPKESQE